jgi:hypothetical protein
LSDLDIQQAERRLLPERSFIFDHVVGIQEFLGIFSDLTGFDVQFACYTKLIAEMKAGPLNELINCAQQVFKSCHK